jgi:hypothetical protein
LQLIYDAVLGFGVVMSTAGRRPGGADGANEGEKWRDFPPLVKSRVKKKEIVRESKEKG